MDDLNREARFLEHLPECTREFLLSHEQHPLVETVEVHLLVARLDAVGGTFGGSRHLSLPGAVPRPARRGRASLRLA